MGYSCDLPLLQNIGSKSSHRWKKYGGVRLHGVRDSFPVPSEDQDDILASGR